MTAITQLDILNLDAARFAMFFRAYHECSAEIQNIVNDMTAIVVDQDSTADERDLAAAAIVEALFPSISQDVRESDEHRLSDPKALEIQNELDREEAAFADRLKAIMDERGMTQEQLASMTGVGQPAISNILNRHCRPQRRTIARFAEALGIEPSELWPMRNQAD